MPGREERTLRSDFVVHWTGRDIQKDYRNICDVQRQEYLHRLQTTLDTNYGGLWMNEVQVDLRSRPIPTNRAPKESQLKFTYPATCFTEVKLSDVKSHTERYGCLGFGFSRKFVMERYGCPVVYVAGEKEKEDGARDPISQHFFKVLAILDFLKNRTARQVVLDTTGTTGGFVPRDIPGYVEFVENSGIEQFLKENDLEERDPKLIFVFLAASMFTTTIFVKQMSDGKSDHKYEYLDEAEWRIPYSRHMEREGMIKRTEVINLNFVQTYCI